MAFADCIALLNTAAGRTLSDDEVEFIYNNVRKHRDYLRAKGEVTDLEAASLRAANEVANNLQLAAVIERRNAALNLTKRVERVEWAQRTFGNRIARALETTLVGTNFAKTGARDGVAQVQAALRKRYLAGFTNDLVQSDLHGVFASGTMDRDIARALWAIDKGQPLSHLQPEAVKIAEIVHKWQEYSRTEANKAGAWIGKLEGYITRQSHDPLKISHDENAWKADAARLFDLDRMMSDASEENTQKLLKRLWVDLASGNHMKAVDPDLSVAFKGPANLAKKMSRSREIHFKDADAWFEYNQKYGLRNLREAVVSGLSHSAESTGLMQVLGTNPKAQLQGIELDLVHSAKEAGDTAELTKLEKERTHLDNYLAVVDGSANMPGNQIWARRGANIRSWITMSKLGSMIFSQLNDLAIYASAMKYAGRGYLSTMGEAVAGLGTNIKTKERIELLSSLDVTLESMIGEIGRTGSLHDPGGTSRTMQAFMKLNLSMPWTERLRASAAMGLSHHMALQKAKPWEALGEDYQRALTTYGIGAKDWEKIRGTAAKHVDGREYITPELVGQKGLETKLRQYFTDQTGFAVIDADAKTKAMMLQGTRPGTWMGEFARFVMQFKSFTGAYMQKSLGREIYGRGYEGDSLWGALTHGNGEMLGLARIIGVSTLMGYGSLTIKDAIKNKSPRDVSDPKIAWKTFMASMAQGGGAGIYGDFLFGQANRFGGGFIETLAGPGLSTVGKVVDLFHAAQQGDDVAARTFKEIINNTPLLGLFYTRVAFDYLILRDMQEYLNPGFQRRAERRMQKEYGQESLF